MRYLRAMKKLYEPNIARVPGERRAKRRMVKES